MGSQFDGLYSCGNCGYGIYARLIYSSKDWEFFDCKDRNKDLDTVEVVTACPRCNVELASTTVVGIPDLKKDEPAEAETPESDSEKPEAEAEKEPPPDSDKVIVERIVETERLGKSWGNVIAIFAAMVIVSIVSIMIDRQFRTDKKIYIYDTSPTQSDNINQAETKQDDKATTSPRKLDLRKNQQQSPDEASLGDLVERKKKTLDDALVLSYPFDGNARDASGNNFHATVIGATPTADRFGKANAALLFDGINDNIKLPPFEVGEDMTISLWCNFQSFNYMSRLVDLGNGSKFDNIVLCNERRSAKLSFYIYRQESITSQLQLKKVLAPENAEKNKWMHVAGTIGKDGALKLFVNGEKINSNQAEWTPSKQKRAFQYVGKSNWPDDEYFHGMLDDLRIWDRELTESEIASLAKNNQIVAEL